jgi:hypothetical protein
MYAMEAYGRTSYGVFVTRPSESPSDDLELAELGI